MKRIFTVLTTLFMAGSVLPGYSQAIGTSPASQQVQPQVKAKKRSRHARALYTATPNNANAATPASANPAQPNTNLITPASGTADNNNTVAPGNNTSYFQPMVDNRPNGAVNWTEQYIEAKGESAIDTVRFKNKAQAKAMARRGAVVIAQRNLLEIVKGVNVTSETTVENMMTTSDYVYTRVDGIIKGAEQVGEAIEQDGLITVRLRMPIYRPGGLASALYSNLPGANTAANTQDGTQAPVNTSTGSVAAGNGTVAAQNAAPTGTAAGSSSAASTGNSLMDAAQKIVVNLGGKKFDPSMFPVLMDENGNILLDTKKLYDPATGQFPQIAQASKELLNAVGSKQGVQIIDAIQDKLQTGKITIANSSKSKINWEKIGTTAAKVGKILLAFL